MHFGLKTVLESDLLDLLINDGQETQEWGNGNQGYQIYQSYVNSALNCVQFFKKSHDCYILTSCNSKLSKYKAVAMERLGSTEDFFLHFISFFCICFTETPY